MVQLTPFSRLVLDEFPLCEAHCLLFPQAYTLICKTLEGREKREGRDRSRDSRDTEGLTLNLGRFSYIMQYFFNMLLLFAGIAVAAFRFRSATLVSALEARTSQH